MSAPGEEHEHATQWHVGLHRLEPTLEVPIPLVDCHVRPCELGPEEKKAPFTIEEAREQFGKLARSSYQSLQRDAKAIGTLIDATQSRTPPKFPQLVKSVLGGTLDHPSVDRLKAARDRAEKAFRLAFPEAEHDPYTAGTIDRVLESHSKDMSDAVVVMRRVRDVIELLRDPARPYPEFELGSFEATPAFVAQVTTDDDAKTTLSINSRFDPKLRPGLGAYALRHEATHVAQLDWLRKLDAEGDLPPHMAYSTTLAPTAMGVELGAEGLIFLPKVDALLSPIERWRALSMRAHLLAMSDVFMTMDTQTPEQAVAFVDGWAPDPSNDQVVRDYFELIDDFGPVFGPLMLGPYMYAAQLLDKAAQKGAAEKVVTAAIRGPMASRELAALANGRSLPDEIFCS